MLELNLHTHRQGAYLIYLIIFCRKWPLNLFSEGRRCLQNLISPLHWFLKFSLPSGKVGTGWNLRNIKVSGEVLASTSSFHIIWIRLTDFQNTSAHCLCYLFIVAFWKLQQVPPFFSNLEWDFFTFAEYSLSFSDHSLHICVANGQRELMLCASLHLSCHM